MKPLPHLLLCSLLLAVLSCSAMDDPAPERNGFTLMGSTPGDSIIKSILNIPQNTPIDFIRWQLYLHTEKKIADSFYLDISFGMSKPNTLGFMDDHGKKTYSGTYTIINSDIKPVQGRIYHFKSPDLTQTLSIVQLDDNVYHLLRPGNRLIGGNGGWSYTLNRARKTDISPAFAAVFPSVFLFSDTATQVTFEGRTPCNIARDYKMDAGPDCFKLKWRLVLYRDPENKMSGTYRINRTLSRTQPLSGRWVIQKHPTNPYAQMLQLDPGQPEKALAFLIADQDVLFFLDKQFALYLGNKDFSYTLNRKTW